MADLDFRELQLLAASILGCKPEAVQLDKSLQRDLAADSMDVVELITAVEDKYKVELPIDELEHMHQISDLWAYLTEQTAPA